MTLFLSSSQLTHVSGVCQRGARRVGLARAPQAVCDGEGRGEGEPASVSLTLSVGLWGVVEILLSFQSVFTNHL